MKLTTHLHLVPRLRIGGAVLLRPLYVFMAWTGTILPSLLFSHVAARAFSLSRLHNHTQTHHIRWDCSGRVSSPTQRRLPDKTQQSQQTDVHAPGGIRTQNPIKRVAADPCHGHWELLPSVCLLILCSLVTDYWDRVGAVGINGCVCVCQINYAFVAVFDSCGIFLPYFSLVCETL